MRSRRRPAPDPYDASDVYDVYDVYDAYGADEPDDAHDAHDARDAHDAHDAHDTIDDRRHGSCDLPDDGFATRGTRRRRARAPLTAGAPAPPEWGNRHAVVCGHCDAHDRRVVLAFVAQRIVRLPTLALLVPAEGAIGDGGRPDLVELEVRQGDWVLWPICGVGTHPSGPRRVALPAAGLQWVDCPACGTAARLDLRVLAARLPSGRALVA